MITKTDVICDSCGKSCGVPLNVPKPGKKPYVTYEYMSLSTKWGYGSSKDCISYEAQICEKCVDEKLNFIKFKKSEYEPFSNI